MLGLILIYACLSAFGLVFLKMGAQNDFSFSFLNGAFNLQVNVRMLIGFILYLAAFVSSLIVMKYVDLNYFYPISVGLVYVLVCFSSYFMLHEKFSVHQLVGIGFIMVGVLFMNIKR